MRKDEFLKQHAIWFSRFRDDYKRAESDRVRREQKRLGGIFSWIGAKDEAIYEQFLAAEGCPIKFRHPVLFNMISEKEGKVKQEGRAMDIDYINKKVTVEYFNPSLSVFEFKVFQMDEISANTLKN